MRTDKTPDSRRPNPLPTAEPDASRRQEPAQLPEILFCPQNSHPDRTVLVFSYCTIILEVKLNGG
jgi:hypothetical protein